jgi:8-oxo-dGTP pyrophosphatase MutT (NUDIX family)
VVPDSVRVVDAAAAVIRVGGNRYLMQLRDQRPDIWYPGCWGCFGGALDAGESPLEALRRELREEIELEVGEAQVISRLEFDFEPLGLGRAARIYYLVDIPDSALGGLRLHEGERMEALTYEALLSGIPVVPYDAFAVHLAGSRQARSRLPMYNPAPR